MYFSIIFSSAISSTFTSKLAFSVVMLSSYNLMLKYTISVSRKIVTCTRKYRKSNIVL